MGPTRESSMGHGGGGAEDPTVAPDFASLYRTEFAAVVRVVTSVVGRRDVAEEIAQEAFVVTYDRWARISRYDRPGDFVRRVALNRAVSHFRRRGAEARALERAGPVRASFPANDPPADHEVLWA